MRVSGTNAAILALALAHSVVGHTTFTNFFVDGVDQGDGVCVRMNKNNAENNFPVNDVTGHNMVCGFDGLQPVSRVCSVRDGATLTFEFRSDASDPNKEAIAPGHVGPCSIYLKKVDTGHESGEGDGWFKLVDEGYDEKSKKWCNIMLNENNNHLTVKLPKGLVGGYYLARPELLALHAVPEHDPQFYTGCAQIFIHSDGKIVPTKTVSIPGYVHPNDPALTFNVYETPMALPYPLPGPPPAKFEVAKTYVASQHVQDEGLIPKGCILQNGNWCAKEVPSYNDQAGCWDAAQNCWDQDKACWNHTRATGGENCRIWEDKCRAIGAKCKAGDWTGPPHPGKTLTPSEPSIYLGEFLPPAHTYKTVAAVAPSHHPKPGKKHHHKEHHHKKHHHKQHHKHQHEHQHSHQQHHHHEQEHHHHHHHHQQQHHHHHHQKHHMQHPHHKAHQHPGQQGGEDQGVQVVTVTKPVVTTIVATKTATAFNKRDQAGYVPVQRKF